MDIKSNIIVLETSNFSKFINQDKPVLIDFWASWCRPCLMAMPIVEELSKVYPVGKVNVDEVPSIADEYEINAIPTMMIFKNGEKLKSFVGIPKKDEIEAFLKN